MNSYEILTNLKKIIPYFQPIMSANKIKYTSAYLCPDFFELARKTTSKNLWHPPEALGQQDVDHLGVAAGCGVISLSSAIQ